MTQLIIYPNDAGGVAIVCPAPNCGLTLDELAAKDVPEGKPYKIIDREQVPDTREARNAWTPAQAGFGE